MSIFADNAQEYFEAGYNVLPLTGKCPKIFNWQEWGRDRQPQFVLDSWIKTYASHNIGFPTGVANGVLALDFDHDVDGLHEKIMQLLPERSAVKKKGAKGFTAFYQYSGETNRKWRKNEKGVLELLCTGNQTVLPPSIHPDTGSAYVWITPDTLLDVKPEDLPCLPEDFCQKVDALFGIDRRMVAFGESDKPDIEVVASAMQWIPAIEYSVWLEVGMGLHHSYGDVAFGLWDKWSATAVNYDAPAVQKKWASFGKYQSKKITAGSILHYAMQYGWLPSSAPTWYQDGVTRIVCGDDNPVEPQANEPKSEPKATMRQQQTLPEHLLNAPNLVGQLAAWIDSTSQRFQPALSLAASLSAIGCIMAHRYRTETDLRSNLMTAGIVGSGLGKDNARKCINVLLDEVGLGDKIIGDFASDAAVINALHKRNGIAITMTDELGDSLSAMSGKGASPYESRIMKITKELFSSANSIYRGKEYANHDGKQDAKVINQPCFCVYGTSTEKQFYNALSGDKVLDGFLTRWLVFFGDGYAPLMKKPSVVIEPPQKLVESVRHILSNNPYDSGLVVGKINPTTIPLSEGARERFNQLESHVEEMRIREYEKQSGFDAVYARTTEHAHKLALVACDISTGIIDVGVASWACDLALCLSQQMIVMARTHIGASDYERDLMAVLDYIRTSEDGRTKRDVVRKFQKIEPRTLNAILQALCEAESIYAEERKGTRGKPFLSFYVS